MRLARRYKPPVSHPFVVLPAAEGLKPGGDRPDVLSSALTVGDAGRAG